MSQALSLKCNVCGIQLKSVVRGQQHEQLKGLGQRVSGGGERGGGGGGGRLTSHGITSRRITRDVAWDTITIYQSFTLSHYHFTQ